MLHSILVVDAVTLAHFWKLLGETIFGKRWPFFRVRGIVGHD